MFVSPFAVLWSGFHTVRSFFESPIKGPKILKIVMDRNLLPSKEYVAGVILVSLHGADVWCQAKKWLCNGMSRSSGYSILKLFLTLNANNAATSFVNTVQNFAKENLGTAKFRDISNRKISYQP
jgi:hypothetical protein